MVFFHFAKSQIDFKYSLSTIGSSWCDNDELK